MPASVSNLPNDPAKLRALVLASRAALAVREDELNETRAALAQRDREIEALKLTLMKTGNEVVVNVTLAGHPLEPGIVVREVIPSGDGNSVIINRGEGNGALQKPGAPFANMINGVWKNHRPRR